MDLGSEAMSSASRGSDIVAFAVVALFWAALFCWLTVVGWATQRRKEREAYYRHEVEKRLVDKGEVSAEQLLYFRTEEERIRWLRRREGLKLGGLITAAAGIGVVVALRFVDAGELSISPIGWIPLGVGVVLLLYAYVLYPDFTIRGSSIRLPPSDERRGNAQD